MNFSPIWDSDEARHRAFLAEAANAALRGETHNTGRFTVPAGSESFTLQNARIGVGKEIILVPRNAPAASLQWYADGDANGEVVIQFLTAPDSDALFGFAVIGVGGVKNS